LDGGRPVFDVGDGAREIVSGREPDPHAWS